jgi:hypothetical protein
VSLTEGCMQRWKASPKTAHYPPKSVLICDCVERKKPSLWFIGSSLLHLFVRKHSRHRKHDGTFLKKTMGKRKNFDHYFHHHVHTFGGKLSVN